jgi:hypothetical protein
VILMELKVGRRVRRVAQPQAGPASIQTTPPKVPQRPMCLDVELHAQKHTNAVR